MNFWLIEDCCEYNTNPTRWEGKDNEGHDWYVKQRLNEIYTTRKEMKEKFPDNPNVIEPLEKPWEEKDKLVEELTKRPEIDPPYEEQEEYNWSRFIFGVLVLVALFCFLGNLI